MHLQDSLLLSFATKILEFPSSPLRRHRRIQRSSETLQKLNPQFAVFSNYYVVRSRRLRFLLRTRFVIFYQLLLYPIRVGIPRFFVGWSMELSSIFSQRQSLCLLRLRMVEARGKEHPHRPSAPLITFASHSSNDRQPSAYEGGNQAILPVHHSLCVTITC